MNIRPLHDRVLVKRLDQEQKTKSGLIIPDTAQEKPMEGEVVSVGSGARDENGKVHPLELKKAIVSFSQNGVALKLKLMALNI
jgi:chaperonin GroES